MIKDIAAWGRRVKLKVHFGDEYQVNEEEEEENVSEKWNRKPTSKTWTPEVDKIVDTYVEKVKHDVLTNLKSSKQKNITSNQQESMKELMNDDSIVIRPSDKGSQIVIFETQEYE